MQKWGRTPGDNDEIWEREIPSSKRRRQIESRLSVAGLTSNFRVYAGRIYTVLLWKTLYDKDEQTIRLILPIAMFFLG